MREALPFERFRPRRADGLEDKELRTPDGRVFRMLHCPAANTYYHLPLDCWPIWDLMDGERTTADLYLAAYEQQGKLLPYAKYLMLLSGLHEKSFLAPPPKKVFTWLAAHGRQRTLWARVRSVYNRRFSLSGLDPLFTRLHALFQPLGRRTFRLAAYGLIAFGLLVFARTLASGKESLLTFHGSIATGILVLVLLQIVITAFHELGHALSMKSIGRRVYEAGFVLSLPIPGAFVNTSDIYLEDAPGRRVRVSWAGPFTDLLVAGFCGVGLVLFPNATVRSILFKTAFLNYLGVFINLNPGRPTDGYYMLVDHLGIQNLLGKVSDYLRRRFVKNLRGEPMTREDRILAAIGILGWLWKLAAGSALLFVWLNVILAVGGAARREWPSAGWWTRLALGLALGVLAAPLAWTVMIQTRRLFWLLRRQLDRIGFFRRDRYVYPTTAAVVLAIAAWPLVAGAPWYPAYALVAGASGLAAGSALSLGASRWQGRSARASSVFLGAWAALGVAATVLRLAGTGGPIRDAIDLGGSACLVLAGLLGVHTSRTVGRGEGTLVAAAGATVLLMAGGASSASLALAASGTGTTSAFLGGWSLALGAGGTVLLVLSGIPFRRSPMALPLASGALGVGLFVAGTILSAGGRGVPLVTALGSVLFPAGLLLCGRALRQSRPAQTRRPPSEGQADPAILLEATRYLAEGVLDALREFFGPSHLEVLEARLNRRLIEDAVPFSAVRGHVRSAIGPDESLDRVSAQCVPFLGRLLEEAAWLAGPRSLDRALTILYDALYWDEREVLGHHVFGSASWQGAWQTRARAEASPEEILRRDPLFAGFAEEEIREMVHILKVREAQPGELLIQKGQPPTEFFVIARGRVEVFDPDTGTKLAFLDAGDTFGEMALTEGEHCLASCEATTTTTLYVVRREDFRGRNRLRDAGTGETLIRRKTILRLLRSVPLFEGAPKDAMAQLVQDLVEERQPAGTVIIRQDEPGETFHIVSSGRLLIVQGKQGVSRAVRRIGPGEFFGEIALVQDCPRTATVRAETEVVLLTLSRASFRRIVLERMTLGDRIRQISSRHLMAADRMFRAEAPETDSPHVEVG
mgnify:CR=1 FL=1